MQSGDGGIWSTCLLGMPLWQAYFSPCLSPLPYNSLRKLRAFWWSEKNSAFSASDGKNTITWIRVKLFSTIGLEIVLTAHGKLQWKQTQFNKWVNKLKWTGQSRQKKFLELSLFKFLFCLFFYWLASELSLQTPAPASESGRVCKAGISKQRPLTSAQVCPCKHSWLQPAKFWVISDSYCVRASLSVFI